MRKYNYPKDTVKNIRQSDQAIVLELTGNIDMERSIDLREILLEILNDKPPILTLNMADVKFMDSSGLGTMIEALKRARRHDVEFKLVGLSKNVRSIFEIAKLVSFFQICDNEDEAL